MDSALIRLPVFLPGSNRDWIAVPGIATITEEGEINIHFQNPEDAESLVKMAKDNVLIQLSFDYRMSTNVVDRINARYKESEE